MRSVDELRELVEDALAELSSGRAGAASTRRSGTRSRAAASGSGPVLCLAVGEAVGAEPEDVLPAACAVELVHSFSLVHDDLPALDDDDERRGRPSTWAELRRGGRGARGGRARSSRRSASRSRTTTPRVARELAAATLGMIGGQYLDVTGAAEDLAALNRLKTGRLFEASVALALEVRGSEPQTWPTFGREVGRLFQLVDDLLDGDGSVLAVGEEETRRRADASAERALAALAELDADTSVLRGIVDGLATRTT